MPFNFQTGSFAAAVSYTHLDVYKRQPKGFALEVFMLGIFALKAFMLGVFTLRVVAFEAVASAIKRARACLLYTSRCV